MTTGREWEGLELHQMFFSAIYRHRNFLCFEISTVVHALTLEGEFE